jgi:hypothetical protein
MATSGPEIIDIPSQFVNIKVGGKSVIVKFKDSKYTNRSLLPKSLGLEIEFDFTVPTFE